MSKILSSIVSLSLCAIVMTACGDDDDGPADATSDVMSDVTDDTNAEDTAEDTGADTNAEDTNVADTNVADTSADASDDATDAMPDAMTDAGAMGCSEDDFMTLERPDYVDIARTCSVMNFGSRDRPGIEERVAECIRGMVGEDMLSASCALCAGISGGCGLQHCVSECIDGGDDCTACLCENRCFARFDACSGVDSGMCDPPACPDGQIECDGACVDGANDANNCGSCGNVCGRDEVCSDGSCGCPEGSEECDGRCVRTDTDPFHCGGCGMECPAGELCHMGSCLMECPRAAETAAHWECGGSCVDQRTDPFHCGGCGTICPADAPVCVSRRCRAE